MTLRDTLEQLARSGRTQDALEELDARFAAGEGPAALILAHWHMIGEFVPRDLAKARDCFAAAAAWGEAAAEAPLVALMANGAGGQPREWPEALARFTAAGANDPMIACQAALIADMAIDPVGNPLNAFAPEFLSRDPLVVLFRNFMTHAECDAVIAWAESRLAPAMVVDPSSGALISDPIRDSSAAAFPFLDENPFLHAINRRIAAASRSKSEQGEPAQVLSYRPGQQYRLHMDAIPGAQNQRIQTMLVYLNDDFDGGATYFPEADLAVKAARGDAICFSNVTADMRPAATARHAGQPVTRGTKFILSRWIRQRPLDLSRPAPGA